MLQADPGADLPPIERQRIATVESIRRSQQELREHLSEVRAHAQQLRTLHSTRMPESQPQPRQETQPRPHSQTPQRRQRQQQQQQEDEEDDDPSADDVPSDVEIMSEFQSILGQMQSMRERLQESTTRLQDTPAASTRRARTSSSAAEPAGQLPMGPGSSANAGAPARASRPHRRSVSDDAAVVQRDESSARQPSSGSGLHQLVSERTAADADPSGVEVAAAQADGHSSAADATTGSSGQPAAQVRMLCCVFVWLCAHVCSKDTWTCSRCH